MYKTIRYDGCFPIVVLCLEGCLPIGCDNLWVFYSHGNALFEMPPPFAVGFMAIPE